MMETIDRGFRSRNCDGVATKVQSRAETQHRGCNSQNDEGQGDFLQAVTDAVKGK